MALVLAPTLAEVRRSVGIRLNFGPQGDTSPDMKNLLDEFIRRAARELILEAQWVELRIRYEVDLIDGQDVYDWPDNMDPGRLERLIVLSVEGHEYELKAGINPAERETMLSANDPRSLPLRYEVVNEDLKILPPPLTERYATLIIEGYTRGIPPTNDMDRIPVDQEALIQKATCIGKKHFGAPDAEIAERDFQSYLLRMRPMQSDNQDFRMGGKRSRQFDRIFQRASGFVGNNYWLQ